MKKGTKKIKNKKECLNEESSISPFYKATLKSVGRVYQAEGEIFEEAVRKIKISGGATAVSVLTVENGDKKIDKILSGIITNRLFGQGSPTTREIYLHKVKQLFEI